MKAKVGYYSSIVGQSIHIYSDSGVFLGQLAMVGFCLHRDDLKDRAQKIADAINECCAEFDENNDNSEMKEN